MFGGKSKSADRLKTADASSGSKSPRSPRFSLSPRKNRPTEADPPTVPAALETRPIVAAAATPKEAEFAVTAANTTTAPSAKSGLSEAQAAAAIQARVRGSNGRKEVLARQATARSKKEITGGGAKALERTRLSQADAATSIQKTYRGRHTRKKCSSSGVAAAARGFKVQDVPCVAIETVTSFGANIATTMSSSARGAQGFAKRKVYSKVQSMVEMKMKSLWERKLKLSLTSDPRMPWFIRSAMHEVGDFLWGNISEELIRAFDKMMDDDLNNLDREIVSPKRDSSFRMPSVPPTPPPSPPAADAAAVAKSPRGGGIVGGTADFLRGSVGAVSAAATVVGEGVVSGATAVGQGVVSGATAVGQGAASVVSDPVGCVAGAVTTSAKCVSETSSSVGKGVVSGCNSLGKGAASVASNPLGAMNDATKTAAGVVSTSSEFTLKHSSGLVAAAALGLGNLVRINKSDLEGNKALRKSDERLERGQPRATVPTKVGLPGQSEVGWFRKLVSILCKLNIWLRRDFVTANVTVDIFAAHDLINADLTDMSDPWCKVSLGRRQKRTRTIENSLDPVWNERFEFRDCLRDLLANPVNLTIFDEDITAHEQLGTAKLPHHTIFDMLTRCPVSDIKKWAGVDTSASASPDGSAAAQVQTAVKGGVKRSFDLQLSTQGWVEIDVEVSNVEVMPWHKALPLMFASLFDIARMMFKDIPWTIYRIFKAVLELPSRAMRIHMHASRVSITVSVERATGIENADDGVVGGLSDPYVSGMLGGVDFHTRTIQDTLNPVWNETFHFESVRVRDLLANPFWLEVMDEDLISRDDSLGYVSLEPKALEALVHEVRAAGPIDEPRRYELPLSTQGSMGFAVSISSLTTPSWKDAWVEAVRPLLDAVRAFILYNRIPFDRGTWSKLRDWRAVLVLFIASSTNVLVRGSFFTAYLLSVMVEMEEYQLTRFVLALKGFQFISGAITLVEKVFGFWECTVLSEDGAGCVHLEDGSMDVPQVILLIIYLQGLLWCAVLLLPYTGRFNAKTGIVNYKRQEKLWTEATTVLAKEETAKQLPTLPPAAPFRPASGQFDAEQAYGYDRLKDAIVPDALFAADVGIITKARRLWWVVLYPIRSKRLNEHSRNRLLSLVHYDFYAFIFSFGLFALLAYQGARLEERMDASALQQSRCGAGGACEPVREWSLAQHGWLLWYFSLGGGWSSWRCKISFSIAKLIFALSAAPFFPLTISIINQLFTHADATAYTSTGRLTQIDTNGLSAYVAWLREDVLHSTRFDHELHTDLTPKDIDRLSAALKNGEEFLETVWACPVGNVKRRCLAKKKELEKIVSAIINRASASDALFTHCFPNEVLLEQFRENMQQEEAAKNQREKKAQEEKEANATNAKSP